MEKIKIFVIDNNSIFREGLRRSFDSVEDFDLLGDTNIDEEALELVMTFAPEIVLLDIGMPLLAGLDLARQITQKSPGVSIVVLDSFGDDEHLFQAVKSGAAGYLTKNVTPDELASTIRRLYQGENVISEKVLTRPKVAERVLKQFQDLSLMGVAMEALTVPLTPRELEVLSYVARGYINKAVAHKLCVSEQTVKNHMSSILHKLDANDRTQAVVLAMHYGWISLRVTKPSDSLIKD